jgi:UDP-N-acetylmuramoylalanine--D-glutamate ligase
VAAKRAARPGDVILLSPGCASFGLFRDEFDRGERFREAVAGLSVSQPNDVALTSHEWPEGDELQ